MSASEPNPQPIYMQQKHYFDRKLLIAKSEAQTNQFSSQNLRDREGGQLSDKET